MNLFINYYLDARPERQKEFDDCLRRNIESKLFKLHILKERDVSLPSFAKGATQLECGQRPIYSDFFSCVTRFSGEDDINIISNSDIYFDDSARLAKPMGKDDFYCLTRYNVCANGASIFYQSSLSQDVWIFSGKPKAHMFRCDFTMGRPRCDGRLAFEARCCGYRVLNPSLSIRTHHLHLSGIRNYDYKFRSDTLTGHILHLRPMRLEDISEKKPRLVSVIVACDNPRHINLCLSALSQQTYPLQSVEVILANSQREMGGMFYGISHLKKIEAETGLSLKIYATRNESIRHSRGDVLAFTSADCIPSPSWLDHGLIALEENDCGLVGGRIDSCPPKGSVGRRENIRKRNAFSQKYAVNEHSWASTLNAFTLREVIDRVGMFNVEMESQSEREWGNRIADAGYNLAYCDYTIVQRLSNS